MIGRHRGSATKIQNSALSGGFYRVWCVLHQLDIVVQKCANTYFNDDFYSGLTRFIVYLRRQQNLIQNMASKCPKVADTRWLSLRKVCQWFCRNKTKIWNTAMRKIHSVNRQHIGGICCCLRHYHERGEQNISRRSRSDDACRRAKKASTN